MERKQKILDFVRKLSLEEGYLPKFAHNLNPNSNKIFYSGPFYDENEMVAAIDTLLFGEWAVNGEKVREFEDKFSELVNQSFSVACNSGSSSNLVLITAVKEFFKFNDGDEIIVSPCGFPTTVSPICQNNLKPVFVDIEWETLNFDLNLLISKITNKTKAIFVSPVLGNCPNIEVLKDIAQKFNLVLLLDGCDSLGTLYKNKPIQNHFFASTNSGFPAHHLVLLNSGIVSSNNYEFSKVCRSLVSWAKSCFCRGKANLLTNGTCKNRFSNWLENYDGIVDHKYVFERFGYNLQLLDLQAAIGIEQIKKFPKMEESRRYNYNFIVSVLKDRLGAQIRIPNQISSDYDISWFGIPIVCQSKEFKISLVSYLESKNIQTRNYFAGNLLLHKGFKHLDDYRLYPQSNKVLDLVFFLGCWPGYNNKQLNYIKDVICEFKP